LSGSSIELDPVALSGALAFSMMLVEIAFRFERLEIAEIHLT
jgi:hypothetical protein